MKFRGVQAIQDRLYASDWGTEELVNISKMDLK